MRKVSFGLTKRCKTPSPSWESQRPMTGPSPSRHCFTLSMLKSKNPVIADFDRAHATWWDSCLCEGIRRRFASEVACLNGKHCVDTFLDLEKFYDSIDNVKLMYMSLLVHMAPRVLRIGDLWGEWISPCNCILHGCGSSNSWARALLYRLVQNLYSHFRVQIGQQVDNINHNSQGTFFQALHWSVEATCMLDRGPTSLGLTISHNKSMVVASHLSCYRCSA